MIIRSRSSFCDTAGPPGNTQHSFSPWSPPHDHSHIHLQHGDSPGANDITNLAFSPPMAVSPLTSPSRQYSGLPGTFESNDPLPMTHDSGLPRWDSSPVGISSLGRQYSALPQPLPRYGSSSMGLNHHAESTPARQVSGLPQGNAHHRTGRSPPSPPCTLRQHGPVGGAAVSPRSMQQAYDESSYATELPRHPSVGVHNMSGEHRQLRQTAPAISHRPVESCGHAPPLPRTQEPASPEQVEEQAHMGRGTALFQYESGIHPDDLQQAAPPTLRVLVNQACPASNTLLATPSHMVPDPWHDRLWQGKALQAASC